MFKTMIAVFAVLALTASFASGVNAQSGCVNASEEGIASAYPAHALCR